jgi:hypothetical protein
MKAWPVSTLALVAAPLLAIQQEGAEPEPQPSFAVDKNRKPASALPLRPTHEAVSRAIHDTLAERKIRRHL